MRKKIASSLQESESNEMQASYFRGVTKRKYQGMFHQFQLYFSNCWLITLKQFRMSQEFSLLSIS